MPFPSTFSTLLISDLGLRAALTSAVAETHASFPSLEVPLRMAISIVAIDESKSPPTFRHAGFKEDETHFSASLLKVAAMFAAFELRQSANTFALTAGDSTPAELFAHMKDSFDDTIANAVGLISGHTEITRAMKVPKYPAIFEAVPLASGGFLINFNATFRNNLRGMIVDGTNPSAGACIQQLGYSWINGMLERGGFFNGTTEQGIWLAGTFVGAFPPVRIASVNDGLVAQAMTCFDLANVYALLFQKREIDSQGADQICDEMLALLAESAAGTHPSWMEPVRPGITGLGSNLTITHTKLGLGTLKPENGGFDVASDGTILQHNPTGKKFITVWQNAIKDNTSLSAASSIVERTIKHFLGIP